MDRETRFIYWDQSKEFEFKCDASNIEIGAVLRQDKNSVAYISRLLNKYEKNYGITEKETLAAVWSINKFEFYLYGKKFKLITDHKALEQIKNKNKFGFARTQRWLELLTKFDFEVIYKPGREIITADALSRAFNVNKIDDEKLMKEKLLKFIKNIITEKR